MLTKGTSQELGHSILPFWRVISEGRNPEAMNLVCCWRSERVGLLLLPVDQRSTTLSGNNGPIKCPLYGSYYLSPVLKTSLLAEKERETAVLDLHNQRICANRLCRLERYSNPASFSRVKSEIRTQYLVYDECINNCA